ncbi:hypothetical protein [Paracoccus sp. SCSIO 75233]|uniref:hypothetical protein n=1 Tax=Paracoccus sp. SCSIO 75233 TaxID=3017782 RepID=UPI0022F031CD|nr:hypothetical protein [Paracoccus sp. SCSIO 75233]WBU53098.1 hypothetical protein PAF12_14975 [Paracoccus sp. SCSIO 75233]
MLPQTTCPNARKASWRGGTVRSSLASSHSFVVSSGGSRPSSLQKHLLLIVKVIGAIDMPVTDLLIEKAGHH